MEKLKTKLIIVGIVLLPISAVAVIDVSCYEHPPTADLDACLQYLAEDICGTASKQIVTSTKVITNSYENEYYKDQYVDRVDFTGYLCINNGEVGWGSPEQCAHHRTCSYSMPKNYDLSIQTTLNSFNKLSRNPICAKGSIININNLSVGESINITGTGLRLFYTTQNDPKKQNNYRINEYYTFNRSGPDFPLRLKLYKTDSHGTSMESAVDVLNFPFIFDQTFNGQQSNGNVNPFVDSEIFQLSLDVIALENQSLYQDVTPTIDKRQVNLVSYKPMVWGLGGWSISIHHYFDPFSKTLFYGNGGVSTHAVKKILLPEYGDVYIAANEPDTEAYIFDMQGRHLETRTGLLAATMYKFIYDDQNRLTKVINQNGLETKFIRDSTNKLAQIIAPFGQTTNVQINEFGRLISIMDPEGAIHSMAYGAGDDLLSSLSYPDNHSVAFEYDSYGLLKKETRSDGFFQAFENATNEFVRTVTHITTSGVKKIHEFSADTVNENVKTFLGGLGVVEEVKMSSSAKTINEFDGELTTNMSFDPRWGTATYPSSISYNSHVSGISSNITFQKSVTLGDQNNPLSLQSLQENAVVNGKKYSSLFDATEKTLTLITPLGRKRIMFFDDKERVTQTKETDGRTSTITYNNLGQIAQLSESPIKTYKFGYDSFGNLESIFDSLKNETRFIRDNNGRVTQKMLPNREIVKFEYTKAGNIKKITTPSNQVHIFERGVMDVISQYIPPLLGISSSQEQYFYDQDKRISKIQKPSGRDINFSYYPETSYISKITTSAGSYSFNLPNAKGMYSSVVSPDNFKIDIDWQAGNPDKQTLYDTNGVEIGHFEISRDADFKISSIGLRGTQFTVWFGYTYDDDGRLISMDNETYSYQEINEGNSQKDIVLWQWNGGNVKGKYETIYLANENQIGSSLEIDSGTANYRTYSDELHQSFSTSSGATNNLYNEYFANNEKKFKNETHTFDANHRLISTSKTFGIMNDSTSQSDTTVDSYTFGSNNNVIEYKFGAKRTVASYDEQDRLLKLRGSISRDFTYNPDGDLEKISNCLGEKKFEYDEFSNLKKVTLPSGKVIEYKIDAFNRRVARLINGVVDKYYMWYDQTHLAAIFDKDRNMQQYYIWGINKFAPAIIVDLTDGRQYKVHATLSGSIRHIVNYEGKVIQEIEYDELGMITNDTNPGFQPFGYNGGLWDPETQLVRFGARDYDPSVSRWTTKDPIGFDGGDTNLYGYVLNDPVNRIDPSGLDSEIEIYDSGHAVLRVDNSSSSTGSTYIDFYPNGIPAWPLTVKPGVIDIANTYEGQKRGSLGNCQSSPEQDRQILQRAQKMLKNPPNYQAIPLGNNKNCYGAAFSIQGACK